MMLLRCGFEVVVPGPSSFGVYDLFGELDRRVMWVRLFGVFLLYTNMW